MWIKIKDTLFEESRIKKIMLRELKIMEKYEIYLVFNDD